MKSILLHSIGLFCFLFCSSLQSFCQDDRYHSIVAQTEAFTPEELDALEEYLAAEYNFLVPGGCRETGLVLVEYPANLSVRTGTAETMVIQAIEEVWHQGATIVKDLPREEILSCIED